MMVMMMMIMMMMMMMLMMMMMMMMMGKNKKKKIRVGVGVGVARILEGAAWGRRRHRTKDMQEKDEGRLEVRVVEVAGVAVRRRDRAGAAGAPAERKRWKTTSSKCCGTTRSRWSRTRDYS